MQKSLLIYRDEAIIKHIDKDYIVFYPRIIGILYRFIYELDYKLFLLIDNSKNPQYQSAAQKHLLNIFENENIFFEETIDLSKNNLKSFLFEKYKNFDIKNSYIIGKGTTCSEQSKNLETKCIILNNSSSKDNNNNNFHADSWEAIFNFISGEDRSSEVIRNTSETKIYVNIKLNGSGKSNISTGIGFFDHMLELFCKHSLCDLTISTEGDLHVDEHHTIEDTAIALGEAILQALGTKKGIERYGFLLPMDDSLAQVAIDFSGRSWLGWDVSFKREKIGDFPTEMFYHFFKSFADAAKCNLNIKASGENEHHKIESIFKAVAKAFKKAIRKDPYNSLSLPSTKGIL